MGQKPHDTSEGNQGDQGICSVKNNMYVTEHREEEGVMGAVSFTLKERMERVCQGYRC